MADKSVHLFLGLLKNQLVIFLVPWCGDYTQGF